MSPAFRGELQALLARKVSEGVPQRTIASEAGVRQPMVSLAMRGSLIEKTESVTSLFEYLSRSVEVPPRDERISRTLDPRLADALARLSDGSPDGDARLASVLEAIAALRPDSQG
ncbi:MAG: hypothetical protein MIN69_19935 [Methylorubrum extorquens]|jgi:hypothetical protein|uniref:hypothetical protein n=1 Tax=Methylorubrum extorquens TaxID=408 RepID=UPI002FEE27C6